MCIPELNQPLLMLIGPTAVGKTAVSIPLARKLNGEIISADSRLFYKGMDIGTAKPSREERGAVPHHLIDVSTPDQHWSLSEYTREAKRVIHEVHNRGRLPIMVGGTGQYVMAILEGWELPGNEPDQRLRTALESWGKEIGPENLHRKLSMLDPESAQSIDRRNIRRVIRALEVILSSGRKFSSQRIKTGSPYSILVIGLRKPRKELFQLIDQRIEGMVAGGFVKEVQSLLETGYPDDLPAFSAIGYRQIIEYLRGSSTLEESVQSIKRNTRRYVRRQDTWFKQEDERIHWLDNNANLIEKICQIANIEENWILPKKNRGLEFHPRS